MSKYKDMVKNGWHPEKAGTTLKGQVKGLVGRNKSDDVSSNHVARPLSSLRDPSTFDAPPKRRGTGLIPAPPPPAPEKRRVITAPSKYQDPRAAPVAAPVGQKQLTNEPHEPEEERQEEEQEGERPPQPYRVNTTGLATEHLPKPPGRRDGTDGRPPPPYQAVVGAPPSLPPRLPPRTNSAGSVATPPAVSPAATGSSGYLNQSAVNRLGAAGVSVPGLGIGRSSPSQNDATQGPPQPPRPGAAPRSHMNELQNRFSKLSPSSSSPSTTPPPAQGTTWAQKQAALRTASSFQKDPSSVSLSDARAAASTANNFRQRHGEQVAAGVRTANSLNQKYGVVDKVGGLASGGVGPGAAAAPQGHQTAASPVPGLAGKKKPPPPPPKKKPGLGGAPLPPAGGAADDAPPPVPISTRPQF